MPDQDWRKWAARNRISQETNGQWGRVGADWTEKSKVAISPDAGTELGDEIRWGANFTATLNVLGAGGTFDSGPTDKQLIQMTRPARTWSINLAMSIMSGGLPDPAHDVLQGLFHIETGVGSSKISQYVLIPGTALIQFRQQAPTANVILEQIPARDIIVSCFVRWTTDGALPTRVEVVQLSAAVAPIER